LALFFLLRTRVFVKLPSGRLEQLNINLKTTVSELKKTLTKKTGLPVSEQRLFYSGVMKGKKTVGPTTQIALEPDSAILGKDLGLKSKALIHLQAGPDTSKASLRVNKEAPPSSLFRTRDTNKTTIEGPHSHKSRRTRKVVPSVRPVQTQSKNEDPNTSDQGHKLPKEAPNQDKPSPHHHRHHDRHRNYDHHSRDDKNRDHHRRGRDQNSRHQHRHHDNHHNHRGGVSREVAVDKIQIGTKSSSRPSRGSASTHKSHTRGGTTTNNLKKIRIGRQSNSRKTRANPRSTRNGNESQSVNRRRRISASEFKFEESETTEV